MEIDWSKFDWREIVWNMHNTAPAMSSNGKRIFATMIRENAVANHSGGQLKYVGDKENGYDFRGCDGLQYELKCGKDVTNSSKKGKYKGLTKSIRLKNTRINDNDVINQTFHFIIVIDTIANTVLLAPWTLCMENVTKVRDGIDIRLPVKRCKNLARSVVPVDRPYEDINQKIADFISERIPKSGNEKPFEMNDDPLVPPLDGCYNFKDKKNDEGSLEEFLEQ